jgi:hypothetical protein
MTDMQRMLDAPVPGMDPALARRVRLMLDGQPDGPQLADMLGVTDSAPRSPDG